MLVKADARSVHITLAGLLDAKRAEVRDLERRVHDCPHDWTVASSSVETLYPKGGYSANGAFHGPVHYRVTTSVCRRCGTSKFGREKDHG